MNGIIQDWNDYGIDWDGPIPLSSEENNIDLVDEIENLLSPSEISDLQEQLLQANPTQSLDQDNTY